MNIDLTDREMQLLIDCIGTNIETVKRRHDPLNSMVSELLTELADLDMDLREALHRQDDGWNVAVDAEINETPDAETEMFNAGVEAREKMKATSRAADRRALNFQSSSGDGDRSETQRVDVWDPNDPRNW
jgi:hypothetical protein